MSAREKYGQGTLKIKTLLRNDTGLTPDVDTFVKGALTRIGNEAGFENVQLITTYHPDPAYEWQGIAEPVETTSQDEPRLGNETVLVFPVRTSLGRILADDVDCYIDIPRPISLESGRMLSTTDKAVILEAVGKIELPDDATVKLHVHARKPQQYTGHLYDLQQVKKDAEFHRDAVEFLRSLGFHEVTLAIDIQSSIYLTQYK